MIRKPLTFAIGLICAGFLFVLIPAGTAGAANCDITSVIFNPNGNQAGNWFNRSSRPTFTVTLVGNDECGGQTIQASLVNDTLIGLRPTAWVAQGGITFDQGSNTVTLTLKAGEETCSPSLAADCEMGMKITTSVGTFYSVDVSGKPRGYLIYDCDNRFTLCDQSIAFNFLGISGGKIGGVTVSNTICAYVAGDGVYACINNSNQKAVENKCSELPECNGKDCKSVDTKLCGTRAYNYGCVIFDTQKNTNIYACSPGNKSDCSDASSCAGKSCTKVEPASLCGSVVNGGSGGGTGGTPTTTTQKFELLNPIGVENFQDLINIIGVWIFNLAIPIAVIVIIYAGVLMLTAGGVPARFQKGAKALWYAVLGLAVVLIGKGFVTLIQSILNLRNK